MNTNKKPNTTLGRLQEILAGLFFLTIGMAVGRIFHSGPSAWYTSLAKPWFNPRPWVFGPVWTVLYITIGIIFARLVKQRPLKMPSLLLFSLNIILNFAWTPLFFYLHRIDLALLDLVGMWLSMAAFLKTNRENRILAAPYFAWISFALILNLSIYLLN